MVTVLEHPCSIAMRNARLNRVSAKRIRLNQSANSSPKLLIPSKVLFQALPMQTDYC